VNPEQVLKGLNIINSELAGILDRATATQVLQSARTDVQSSYELYKTYVKQTHQKHEIVESGWGFSIRQRPLQFGKTVISGYPFRVDLTCEFRWQGENGEKYIKRNIAVRLWSLSKDMIFREDWDSERLRALSLKERVMMRFHFDLADPQQSAPLCHLQIGGIAADHEHCWFHPKIEKPRFPHMPMDLVLACELIAATFYEQSYRRIRKSGHWRGVLQQSQVALLKDYFEGCLRAINERKSVLTDFLWKDAQM